MEFASSIGALSQYSATPTVRDSRNVIESDSQGENRDLIKSSTGNGRAFLPDVGMENAVTFWRGRVALYAILKALGIGAGDQVVVPGYTCFAVPSAVRFAGARPIFADIEPATFNVSIAKITAALDANPGRTKAILIQHTYGIPAETEPIVSWARERGIATIEDCAHAWGSRYRDASGKWLPVGKLADAAFFSSQWTKPVSTGLGGWAEARDPQLRAGLQRFRSECCVSPSASEVAGLAGQVALRKILNHPRIDGMVKKLYQALYSRGLVLGTSSKEELRGEMPSGYAKRMSSFQSRMLRRARKDDAVVPHRRCLMSVYEQAVKTAGLSPLLLPDGVDPVLLRYPVRVRNKERVLAEAKLRGFDIGDWYSHPVDRPQSLSDEAIGYAPGSCPEGELASRQVINLPLGRAVTEKSALRTVEFLKEFA